jgi:cytochrome c oxidase subunit 3
MSDHHDKNHPYKILPLSPLPFQMSMSLLVLAAGAIMFMHEVKFGGSVLILGFALVVALFYKWWREVVREGIDEQNTNEIQHGLRLGMMLFIASEVMFFFAFFFSFFSASLFPADIWDFDNLFPIKDGIWPPEGITTFAPFDLPFLNTLILLLSGTTVTWAHHSLLHGDQKGLIQGLTATVVLGFTFSLLQAYEYSHAAFGFTDGVYAANFYLATGFHGFHVIVGTIFLFVCLMRAKKGNLTKENHLGFEFAAWYWHFVDVVWLFLFVAVYWWGGQ